MEEQTESKTINGWNTFLSIREENERGREIMDESLGWRNGDS